MVLPSLTSISQLLLCLCTKSFLNNTCPALPPSTVDCAPRRSPLAILPSSSQLPNFLPYKVRQQQTPRNAAAAHDACWLWDCLAAPKRPGMWQEQAQGINCQGGVRCGWGCPDRWQGQHCRLSASLCQIASPLGSQVFKEMEAKSPYCRQGYREF